MAKALADCANQVDDVPYLSSVVEGVATVEEVQEYHAWREQFVTLLTRLAEAAAAGNNPGEVGAQAAAAFAALTSDPPRPSLRNLVICAECGASSTEHEALTAPCGCGSVTWRLEPELVDLTGGPGPG